jgi:hypothetical protein
MPSVDGRDVLKGMKEKAMLQVTADIFSGRPNPMWEVEADEAKYLLQEISQNPSVIAGVDQGYQGLGYRGLIVESLADNIADKYGLPSTFRVGHSAHPKGLELAERILRSMQQATVLDTQLHSLLMPELERLRSREEVSEPDSSAEPAAQPSLAKRVTCFIEVGAFNPGFWNDPAYIGRNNCYNYASNRRTNTFAQPGRGCGHIYTAITCAEVTRAALCDGLHHRFDCFPDSEKPRWLMALVVAPGYDYHWYRKQKEGFWGHKPGSTAAKNTDNNGAVIWNPETAARSPYTDFCGYFYACKSQKIN